MVSLLAFTVFYVFLVKVRTEIEDTEAAFGTLAHARA
jgi:hypothetical protein